MAVQKWSDVKYRRRSKEQVADLEREVQEELPEMNLRELRQSVGKTQEEMTALMDSCQPQQNSSQEILYNRKDYYFNLRKD